MAEPIAAEQSAARAVYAAKRQPSYVVRSAEITSTSKTETVSASPLSVYLQRLSIDGEHAFGIWDEDAGFSLFSANFDRITGLSSGECAGHDWIHTVHHSQQYALNEALLQAIAGTDGRCLVQARRLNEGSDVRWLLIDIKAATSRQPNIMVLFRDLTEQKALEEALGQTEAALAMSERSRAAFLSSMSHELRTPLNAIMGFSEMMKSGVFGELGNKTYTEYAKHIHDSGSTLLGKINDLLDIASMDAGGLELEASEFFLNQMLTEAMEMHSHHAFARQQQITLDCPLTLEINADRAKILCATSHLLSNALRHSKDGADITVSVRIQHGDGVVISVRDAGEGISSTQLDIIRNALTAQVAYFNIEPGGIGLGLSLAKELAERHGGRVLIDSIRHRGTVVSLMLPTQRIISGLPQRKRRSQ
ncbi:MAG: HAMP domain-containing sensor histidine kinase [Pseudomonadota bacterium]